MEFKCSKGLAQAYLRNKFIVRADVHSLNTRHRNKLDECTAIQNSYRPTVICYRATRLWNELPRTLKDVDSFILNFQAALKSRA